MIRNKVLINGGSLSETEIIWFYPSSMTPNRLNMLEEAWTDFYKRYFGNNNNIYKLSESFAPFYYYYHNQGVRPHEKPGINIDIGGGTTDVVIYKSADPILLTSFKFSANSIFGDGYGYTSDVNGFVLKYESVIKNALNTTTAKNLINIYQNIKNASSNSLELIEFFFSLEQNKFIKDNQIEISFSKLLKEDSDLKLVFVFFYTSIIYHIANLMKSKNMDLPQYLTFSGNGSKIIKIINGGKNNQTLVDYTKVIFSDVYNLENDFDLEIVLFDDPKEITCKGGLECNDFEKFKNLENKIYDVLIGSVQESLVSFNNLTYENISSEETKKSINKAVVDYIDKFFNYHKLFNFQDNFGINPNKFDKYKNDMKKSINNDLISGIEDRMRDVADSTRKVNESLFFYPLKGAINRLATQIYKESQ
jgi:hypothetical protein